MEKEFFVSGNGAQDLNCASERLPNGYLNLNWENSMDHSVPFDSAMSSFVSSPAAGTNGRGPESIVIRELIGRLGSICNSNDISRQSHSHTLNYMGESNASANTSCYSTPLNSPPKINNLSMIGDHHVSVPSHGHAGLAPFPTDPGFAERAARFSCFGTKSMGGLMGQFGFNDMEMPQPQRLARAMEMGKLSRVSSSQSLKVAVREKKEFETDMRSISANERKFSKMSRSSSPDNAEFSNAFASEPTVEDANVKGVGDVNGRKRKAAPRGKAKDFASSRDAKEVAEDGKRCKSNETSGNEKLSAKTKMELNGTASNGGSSEASKKQNKETPKPTPEPPKDYIHVRARRGQATDSHSLAERVRREKISERMKFLQDLVPGCNKVTGKALMLDEIINYVQSLQRQVEFLSMKLATVNPRLDFNMETTLTKDLLQSRESLSQAMYQLNSSVSAFQYGHPGEGAPMSAHRAEPLCSMNPLEATALHRNTGLELPSLDGFGEAAAHFANFWEDDLQSVVQMGFGQNQSQEIAFESQSFPGSLSTTNMKVEL